MATNDSTKGDNTRGLPITNRVSKFNLYAAAKYEPSRQFWVRIQIGG